VKITDDAQVNSLIQNSSSPQKPSKGPGFAETLARSMVQEPQKAQEPSQASQTASLDQSSPVGKLVLASAIETFQHIENALGVLDSYTKALADPGQTLKDVSGLVKEMEQVVDNLKGVSQNLPDGHAVKDLVDRTAIVAAVEAAKFNRGDYL